MNQWSFDIEQGLWKSAAFDIQYSASHPIHLDRSLLQQHSAAGPRLVAARRPNPNFAEIRTIQNDEVANYNGLSIVLRQRLNHGLTMLRLIPGRTPWT